MRLLFGLLPAVFAVVAVAPAWGQNANVLLCAGCHGMSGEGRAAAGYPPLAGQPRGYLLRQLEAYADGRRASRIMTPLAAGLTRKDRERLAGHYAALVAPDVGTAHAARTEASARGRALAIIGDNDLRVPSCRNCHGPGGSGLPPYGPYLAGLPSAYLRAELQAWRSGARRTDPSGHMALIARLLTPEDIAAVSDHYASEPPAGAQVPRAAASATH